MSGGYFPGITGMIRLDHSHALALFRRFKPTTSVIRKRALVANVCLALEIHAQLEEEIFYPALAEAVGNDPTLARSGADHDAIREVIARLRHLEPGIPQYDATFHELMQKVLHHVADEESVVLPLAEKHLAAELGSLGFDMARRRIQLLGPRAPEAATTAALSFPIGSVLLVVAGLAITWGILVGTQVAYRRSARRSYDR